MDRLSPRRVAVAQQVISRADRGDCRRGRPGERVHGGDLPGSQAAGRSGRPGRGTRHRNRRRRWNRRSREKLDDRGSIGRPPLLVHLSERRTYPVTPVTGGQDLPIASRDSGQTTVCVSARPKHAYVIENKLAGALWNPTITDESLGAQIPPCGSVGNAHRGDFPCQGALVEESGAEPRARHPLAARPAARLVAPQSPLTIGSKAHRPAVTKRMSTATRNCVQKRAPSKSGEIGSMSWVVPRAPAITMGTMIG
jgi:hypothetical protein